MKKFLSLFLILLLLCGFPFAVTAEEVNNEINEKINEEVNEEIDEDINEDPILPTFSFTPPSKVFYTVGDSPDYTGGMITYTTAQTEYEVDLSNPEVDPATYCTGFDTSTPGIKTVTVSFAQEAPKGYFTIIVMNEEEPITAMKDIGDSQWFFEAFGITMKAGLFQGDAAGTLRPDAPITRAEFAALIYRAWGSDPQVMTQDYDEKVNSFTDVNPTDWFYDEVEACRKAGILRGYEGGTCLPNEKISRQDAVLMLMRIRYTDEQLAAVNIEQSILESEVNPFDFNDVADYAAPAMALALGDLIRGDDHQKIHPRNTITRAETATIYQRMFFEEYAWTAPEMPKPQPEVPATPKPDPSEMPLIFLSPSSQFDNRYTGVNTTEGIQMNELAKILKKKLEAKGYRVYLPSSNTTYQERAALSNEVGADIHIPLHSNAGGGTGARIFYNGTIQGSKELSTAIFKYLGPLTNSNDPQVPYLKDDSKTSKPYHEIRVPKAEMAYIEVEFHDISAKAQWIVNNKDAIADAIVKGINDYCERYLLK